MQIALVPRINITGMHRLDESRMPLDRYGRNVVCGSYVDIADAFVTYEYGACCSCYSVNNFKYPWIRFTNKQVVREAGFSIEVRWLHFELDLPKNAAGIKCWPGVSAYDGIWQADTQAEDCYRRIIDILAPAGASHYMSRGGLHVLFPVVATPFSDWLAVATAWLKEHVERKMTAVRKIAPLSLDNTCIEPQRLHYLPRITKEGVGQLCLPMHVGSAVPIELPIPAWLQFTGEHREVTIEPLQLKTSEATEVAKFASRWLSSHLAWLAEAVPGSGRNARLYALGGDIRQFEQAGILSKIETNDWLAFGRRAAENAAVRPVHNGDTALSNGYTLGTGSDSVVLALRHLESKRAGKAGISMFSKALKLRR